MRRLGNGAAWAAWAVLGALAWTLHAGAPATGAAAPKRGGAAWPATPAGAIGRQWVEAFARGDTAMRAFYGRALGAKGLAERPVGARVARYRELREQYGTLELFAIVKSTPAELTASLIDADAKRHDFVFTVEASPPHRLVSVSLKQRRHGFGGFHH